MERVCNYAETYGKKLTNCVGFVFYVFVEPQETVKRRVL